MKDVDSDSVLLYHSGNTRGVRHLAVPGDGKTLCRKVDLDYNSKGDLNSTKVSGFKGRDRVLGDLCSVCEKRFEKIVDKEGSE